MVNFVKTDTSLRIEPDPDYAEDLANATSIEEALEYYLCNGWELIRPEECGALTAALIITEDVLRDDDGELLELGRVYWDSNYCIIDALEELQNGRNVEFVAVDGGYVEQNAII